MPDDATIRAVLMQPLNLGRGRRAAPLRADYERDLSLDDLVSAAANEMGRKTPGIKSIRQQHHFLAQVLAKPGTTNNEASAITGYCPSRISILKDDPTFQELLEYYKSMEKEAYTVATADMHKRLATLGFASMEVLMERLEESPDSFTPKDLLSAIELVADRTGHGKSSTVNNVHEFAIDSETLSRIKASTERGRALTEADRQSLLSMAHRAPEAHPAPSEGEGIEGSWTVVREEGGEGGAEPLPPGVVALSPMDRVRR